jgi:hypothetical protein
MVKDEQCMSATKALTLPVNTYPNLRLKSQSASPTAYLYNYLSITYTSLNGSTLMTHTGSLPPNVAAGKADTYDYYISGYPTATGTYGYTVSITTTGCSSYTSGTITVIEPTFSRSSAQTWTFGAQTWSDIVTTGACNKSDFTSNPNMPHCRSFVYQGKTDYYYNWRYVKAFEKTMCVAPWYVPNSNELMALTTWAASSTSNNSALVSAQWHRGGYIEAGSSGVIGYPSSRIWSETLWTDTAAMSSEFTNTGVTTSSRNFAGGMMVRCIRR